MISLASILRITPLSKLQISSKSAVRDSSLLDISPTDLPFWFFQRTVGEFLELRSPGGFVKLVLPADVCDIVPAEPLVVRAVPQQAFVDWLKLPLDQRLIGFTADMYQPAQVLWLTKDRWNRVDSIFVSFLDITLNLSDSFSAPIDQSSRNAISAVATRDRLPISHYRSRSNLSCVNRELPSVRNAKKSVRNFFSQRLSDSGS